MTVRFLPSPRIFALVFAVLCFPPDIAQAHVKWFCGVIDESLPPVPLNEVLSPLHVFGIFLFTALVATGGLIDALLARILPGASAKVDRVAIVGDVVLRLGMALYAFCLWRGLAIVPWADGMKGSLLTPELLSHNRFVDLLQFSIAFMILAPRLSILAAAGIAALYAMGAAKYGLFHMIDYLFFLGIAAYIALSDPLLKGYPGLSLWRVPVLTASISLSLMWTAVEKFLFPQWTISVLSIHPNLTAGYSFATVTAIAGFVEFSLAFYLLVGRAILGRLCALILMAIFVAAMPEFGIIDVVGHISVIVILLVVLLHGETRLQTVFRGGGSSVFKSFKGVGVLYLVTLSGLTLLYYGLHAVLV